MAYGSSKMADRGRGTDSYRSGDGKVAVGLAKRSVRQGWIVATDRDIGRSSLSARSNYAGRVLGINSGPILNIHNIHR